MYILWTNIGVQYTHPKEHRYLKKDNFFEQIRLSMRKEEFWVEQPLIPFFMIIVFSPSIESTFLLFFCFHLSDFFLFPLRSPPFLPQITVKRRKRLGSIYAGKSVNCTIVGSSRKVLSFHLFSFGAGQKETRESCPECPKIKKKYKKAGYYWTYFPAKICFSKK